jgi:hypothetical protein
MKTATTYQTIELDGDTWAVIGLGVRQDEKVYAHLASTTRYLQQRNGRCPIQVCDFISESLIVEAK